MLQLTNKRTSKIQDPYELEGTVLEIVCRPILEYRSSVWEPHYEGLMDDLEKVQKCTARFVARNYTNE